MNITATKIKREIEKNYNLERLTPEEIIKYTVKIIDDILISQRKITIKNK